MPRISTARTDRAQTAAFAGAKRAYAEPTSRRLVLVCCERLKRDSADARKFAHCEREG